MNLKEYSKILNDTLEKVEKETGQIFDKNIEILAINKYLNTPAMKAAYPEMALIHDAKEDRLVLEYKSAGYYKFFGMMTFDGFEFRARLDNRAILMTGIKPIISEETQSAALNIKDLLKPDSTFENFLTNVTVQEIDKVMAVSERDYADFFKVIKMIKEEEPFNREFLKIALKVAKKCHQNDKSIDSHTEDRIYDVIKEGVPEGSDGLSQLRRLLYIEDMDASNYDFEDIDEDRQVEFHHKIINEGLPKNSITHILVNDPKNFIHNVFEELVFDHMKKPLAFTMKLISNDLTVENLYEQHPVVDMVFKEALKQDPLLNELPENLFKHTIVKDKDIYNEETGVDYYKYVEHIVDEFDRAKVMHEHFKTTAFRPFYTIIDPELDGEVIRFTGTTGPDISYMLCATIDKNDTGHHKVLNLDTYLLTKNVTEQELENAVKNVINYCKQNEYILCLNFRAIQHGLNYDESEIVCQTVDKFKNEICSVMIPSSSEQSKLSLMSKVDIPYSEIVAHQNKIAEMIESKVSEEGMIKTLQCGVKPLKLKM